MILARRSERPEGASGPRFAPGDIVRHRRYGYRGVVVDGDASCQAPDEWYLANKTQPKKDQPWYHVLVDGSGATTYAAEENLAADEGGAPIEHPLLDLFFVAYADGRYVRNDRPWGS